MFLFSVLLFFVGACVGAWLLLFPVGRELVVQSLADVGRRLGQRRRHGAAHGRRWLVALCRAALGAAGGGWRFVRRRYALLLSAAVVITVPALLALMLGGRDMLAPYDNDSRVSNEQVTALLIGEQLVAPAPLPPLTFTSAEVTQLRPMLDSANRNWQLLHPEFSRRLLLVFRLMKERHGYDMAILEGYRSAERQNTLAAAGPGVTNARAFQSYHQFGLAADCAFLRDGKLLISERDPWAMRGYRLYGETAESVGLHWGGRWTMMDFGHAELRVAGTVRN